MNHLGLVNAAIGFAKPTSGWPPVLHRHGYALWQYEGHIPIEGAILSPDVVFLNQTSDLSLWVECKGGGGDPKRQQLDRYQRLSPQAINRIAGMPTGLAHRFEVVVLCNEERLEDVLRGREAEGLRGAVLSLASDQLHLVAGSLLHESLDAELRTGVPLDRALAPRSYVPFTARALLEAAGRSPTTDDMLEFHHARESLFLRVLELAMKGETLVTIDELLESLFSDVRLKHIGRKERSALRKLLKGMLRISLQKDGPLEGLLAESGTEHGTFSVLAQVELGDPSRRTQRLQALRRRMMGQAEGPLLGAQQMWLFKEEDDDEDA